MLKGSCLCGGVTFTVDGPVRDPGCCHCSQCRKQSGHYWSSAVAPDKALTVTGDLRWYSATPGIRRGFCPTCGSFLFWKEDADEETGFALGAIDGPTGLTLARHIFVADKGDYYDIADGLRQEAREDD